VAEPPVLLADIGGTHARFALAEGGALARPATFDIADHADAASVARAYLGSVEAAPRAAVFAVAGPVDDGKARLTNAGWSFEATALAGALGLARLELINDFAAVAWALPRLQPGERRAIGGGEARPEAPLAVLGPGTGLGVAGLVPGLGGARALVTEGGHATLAPADARESAILDHLRGRFGHVSAERVLSGEGLVNLYQAIAALAGATPPARSPEEISRHALAGDCAASRAALECFCAMLGGFAGDLALTLGARGGVYLAGGIVPQIADFIAASRFRARFVDKGRLRAYLEAIPTYLVTQPDPAFLGLLAYIEQPAWRASP